MPLIDSKFENDDDMDFPVITISVSNEDLREPIHVDLGSIPPFVAVAVLEKIVEELKMITPSPKITFQGAILSGPVDILQGDIDAILETFIEGDEDDEEFQ